MKKPRPEINFNQVFQSEHQYIEQTESCVTWWEAMKRTQPYFCDIPSSEVPKSQKNKG